VVNIICFTPNSTWLCVGSSFQAVALMGTPDS